MLVLQYVFCLFFIFSLFWLIVLTADILAAIVFRVLIMHMQMCFFEILQMITVLTFVETVFTDQLPCDCIFSLLLQHVKNVFVN